MLNTDAFPLNWLAAFTALLKVAGCVQSVAFKLWALLNQRCKQWVHVRQILSRLQQDVTRQKPNKVTSNCRQRFNILHKLQDYRVKIGSAFGSNDTSLSAMKNLETVKLLFFPPFHCRRKHFTTFIYISVSIGSVFKDDTLLLLDLWLKWTKYWVRAVITVTLSVWVTVYDPLQDSSLLLCE